jgi:hypothetical protein
MLVMLACGPSHKEEYRVHFQATLVKAETTLLVDRDTTIPVNQRSTLNFCQ